MPVRIKKEDYNDGHLTTQRYHGPIALKTMKSDTNSELSTGGGENMFMKHRGFSQNRRYDGSKHRN